MTKPWSTVQTRYRAETGFIPSDSPVAHTRAGLNMLFDSLEEFEKEKGIKFSDVQIGKHETIDRGVLNYNYVLTATATQEG